MKGESTVTVLALLTTVGFGCTSLVDDDRQHVQGSGHVRSETHELEHFTEISFNTMGALEIEEGEHERLVVEAEDNLHEQFEISVSGKRLTIGCRRWVSLRPTRRVRFRLTVRELEAVYLHGSGDLSAPDLEAEHFRLVVHGSGDADIEGIRAGEVVLIIHGSGDVNMGEVVAQRQSAEIHGSGDAELGRLSAERLRVQIHGSGDLDIRGGEVQSEKISIHGSGSLSAARLECSRAKVTIPGSGSAAIHVRDRLEASICGTGDLRYRGNPEVIHQGGRGSGSIRQM